jgi:LPS O-antigen subunit length determinant protein (WzzB/FepE family)
MSKILLLLTVAILLTTWYNKENQYRNRESTMAKTDELQRQTLRVLAELGAPGKPLSARAAGERLDIGYNQIADMARGKTPAEKTLIKFAAAIGESAADWLRYAGKNDFAKALAVYEPANQTAEQQGFAVIARDLAQVPPKRRALLLRQIRALIRATVEPFED